MIPRPAVSPIPPPTIPAQPAGSHAPVALYVHVPFCVSVCPYCDFVVYGGASARGPRNRLAAFVDAVLQEIDLRADDIDRRMGENRPPLETLYLGGGTPSLLPPDAVAAIVARVRSRYRLADGAEITIEVNPGPDERGDAAALVDAGVTRVSIGAQSLHAAHLQGLGRRHRPDDVAAAVQAGRSAGMHSVSLDLLYDVPDAPLETWVETLEAALALQPDHLSLYALTLDDPEAEGLTGPRGDHLPASSGARRWRDRARTGQDDDRAAAAYEHATTRLAAAGLRGYEISNWARPGHESRHNLVYWHRRPYEAVGPGAHAFDGLVRRWNGASLGSYLDALAPAEGRERRLPPGGLDVLDEATAAAEAVILALRIDEGVPAEAADRPPLDRVAPWAIEQGLLEAIEGGRMALTTRGRLLSNEVFARLI